MENSVIIAQPKGLIPTSYADSIKLAEGICKSNLLPAHFQGKPQDVLVAILWGLEIGISPIQAINGISVIRGTPSLQGKLALAVVCNHPAYEAHEEYIEGEGDNRTAVFRIKRKGSDWHEQRFSVKDAKTARLWGKVGPWTDYPDIMLMWRARGFGMDAKFSDALKGLVTKEVADDYIDITPQKIQLASESTPPVIEEVSSPLFEELTLAKAHRLISTYQIAPETISKWCDKANIDSLENASEELLDKFIKGIESKYGK